MEAPVALGFMNWLKIFHGAMNLLLLLPVLRMLHSPVVIGDTVTLTGLQPVKDVIVVLMVGK